MWERGLKSADPYFLNDGMIVTPYVGAWIEIPRLAASLSTRIVAPYVGAWIEMRKDN